MRPVFWLPDHPHCRVFPSIRTVTSYDSRPRLQRRGRNGLAPFSRYLPRKYTGISPKTQGEIKCTRRHCTKAYIHKCSFRYDRADSSVFTQNRPDTRHVIVVPYKTAIYFFHTDIGHGIILASKLRNRNCVLRTCAVKNRRYPRNHGARGNMSYCYFSIEDTLLFQESILDHEHAVTFS